MIYFVNIFLVYLLLISNKSDLMIGKWDLVKNSAFESIQNSDRYLLADIETQFEVDRQFQLVLDSMKYEFKSDTLYYSSIDQDRMINRRAFWKLIGDTLFVKEIDRNYLRKYFVWEVNEDTLKFSPIFYDTKVYPKPGYVFVREE